MIRLCAALLLIRLIFLFLNRENDVLLTFLMMHIKLAGREPADNDNHGAIVEC